MINFKQFNQYIIYCISNTDKRYIQNGHMFIVKRLSRNSFQSKNVSKNHIFLECRHTWQELGHWISHLRPLQPIHRPCIGTIDYCSKYVFCFWFFEHFQRWWLTLTPWWLLRFGTNRNLDRYHPLSKTCCWCKKSKGWIDIKLSATTNYETYCWLKWGIWRKKWWFEIRLVRFTPSC